MAIRGGSRAPQGLESTVGLRPHNCRLARIDPRLITVTETGAAREGTAEGAQVSSGSFPFSFSNHSCHHFAAGSRFSLGSAARNWAA